MVQVKPASGRRTLAESTRTRARYRAQSFTGTRFLSSFEATIEAHPRKSTAGLYQCYIKRSLDFVLGAVLLLLALPVILVLAGIIAVTSGWPSFYCARRVGLGGREFSMWKLRTMVRDADDLLNFWRATDVELAKKYQENFKLVSDPRVTWIGRILRRTSLDELPQLWNVVRGDMSLVGPRPYFRSELEAHPSTRLAVTSVRPGLTGPWQVQGRNVLVPQVRMQLDEWYAERFTLRLDLIFLVKTVKVLLRADGI